MGVVGLGMTGILFIVELLARPVCAGTSRRVSAYSDAVLLAAAVEQVRLAHGLCPRDVWALVAGEVVDRFREDPWGRPYDVTCGEGTAVVCSHGVELRDPGDDVCSDDDR